MDNTLSQTKPGSHFIKMSGQFKIIVIIKCFNCILTMCHLRLRGNYRVRFIIWIPKLVFKNTKERKKSIVDEDAKVAVKRRSQGRQSDESSPENKIIYDGKDNYIEYL